MTKAPSNCQSCKHWKRYDEELGECERIAVGCLIGELTGSTIVLERTEEERYADYDPVYTDPSFGCVLFEAGAQQPAPEGEHDAS